MTKHEQSAVGERGRILYLDLLRVVAATAVVVIHCCAVEFYTAGVRTVGWAPIAAWDSLAR